MSSESFANVSWIRSQVVLKSDVHHFRDDTRIVAVPFVAIYRDGESLEASGMPHPNWFIQFIMRQKSIVMSGYFNNKK